MYEHICRSLIKNGIGLFYTTNRAIAGILQRLKADSHWLHYEVPVNEKIAFEECLAGGIASKKTACIFSSEGIYEAFDPVMSSAYTGVKKGLLIVCIKDTFHDATPIGLFSKLPTITRELGEDLLETVQYCLYISEKYEIPVILQIHLENEDVIKTPKEGSWLKSMMPADTTEFIKDTGRWAATPSFRYELHKVLNQKIERIREEFEDYKGNKIVIKGKNGAITNNKAFLEFYGDDASTLNISTIFPLPVKKVQSFIDEMDEVYLLEGEFPVMELQIPNRKRLKVENFKTPSRIKKHEEDMFGFEVIRDTIGPASSLNIAHGIKKKEPDKNILAITYEDHFLHSGLSAFVNTLYNNSSYAILIMTNKRSEQIKRFMDGCGFKNYTELSKIEDIKEYKEIKGLTVFLCPGII